MFGLFPTHTDLVTVNQDGRTNKNLYYKIALLNSKYSTTTLAILNPTLSYQVGHIKTIPYVEDRIQEVSILSKRCVEISKEDFD